MASSRPLRRYPNYESIRVEYEEPQEVIPGRRRNKLVIAGAILGLGLTCALAFDGNFPVTSSSSANLVGPLLGRSRHGGGDVKGVIKALHKLNHVMKGSVVFANDDGFCEASEVWQKGLKPPLAVVEVASEADVQLAVPVLAKLYTKSGVPFRIRSGGHSYAGFSTVEAGIVLSLSRLNDLEFDVTTGIATIGPAVMVQDMLEKILVPEGYGGVVGECPGVAEGGFVLGGGYGFLSRKYGLGLDSVVRARVVLPDGSAVVASETESPDLFWALRGAGQNMFGVVTQLEYQLHPSQDTQLVVTGDVPLDAQLLTAIGNKHTEYPGELSFLLEGTISHHGMTEAIVGWFGENDASLDVGEAYIEENIVSLLPIDVDMSFDKTSWSEMTREGGNLDGNYVRAWTGFLFDASNTEEVWDRIIKGFKSVCIGNPYLLVDIELWGGTIASKEPEDSAFFYRKAMWNVGLLLLVPTDTKRAERFFNDTIDQVDRMWKHVSKDMEGVYSNYIVESLNKKECARAYWGGNVERLEQLKESYDPLNVFHHPQSILPSGKQPVWL